MLSILQNNVSINYTCCHKTEHMRSLKQNVELNESEMNARIMPVSIFTIYEPQQVILWICYSKIK